MDPYRTVLAKIAAKAVEAGRNPADITLVAVTKTRSWEEIKPLYDAGCRDFGENRVNEAIAKQKISPQDIRWHLIGTLQRKKAAVAIDRFVLIHSVDSLELAKKIDACSSDKKQKTRVLIQVNTSGEASKHGFSIPGLKTQFARLADLSHLQIEGLMTMAPLSTDEKVVRPCFSLLRKCRDELRKEFGFELKELSMGMSQDFEWAVLEGATILRVGSALFIPLTNK